MRWPLLSLLRSRAEEAASDLPSLRMAAEKLADSITQGAHARKKTGGHEEFWQFRTYQDGDRPQDIDWRMSARGDPVFVKEKELQNPQSTFIWCHRGASMDFASSDALRTKLETAQLLSLASAIVLQRAEEQIGFLGQGRASRSDLTLDRVAQQLMESGHDAPLPETSAPKNSTLILCGDFLETLEDINARFESCAAHAPRGIVVQTLDPAEITLPYSGHVVFEDITGGAQQKIDNVSSIREDYQARMKAHIEGVAAICAAHNWAHILHRTDTATEDTLLMIWEHLKR